MSSSPASPAPQRLTLTHWLILVMAAIGFGFDIYVLLIMQYIGRGVLDELLPGASLESLTTWRGILFFVPAFVGGLFGLLGGYLTDLFGRRRVLTGSILLYALSAFASGFSTSIAMFLVLRCLTFIGVCVEFVAAVAWLAELFPNHEQRERALGYTQAFSSLGGFTVGVVFSLLTQESSNLPALVLPGFLESWLGPIKGTHAPWRYTLISGVVPAIPLILIRPFMPESPTWKEKKLAGTLKRPSLAQLFAPKLRRTTIVTTIMFACSYGAAFGAIQQVQFMVPAMPQYQEKAAQLERAKAEKVARPAIDASTVGLLASPGGAGPLLAASAEVPARTKKLAARLVVPGKKKLSSQMTGQFGVVQEVGGLIGRFLLAFLAIRILSRRSLLRVFQVPGLIVVPLVFAIFVLHNRVLFVLPFGGKDSAGIEVTLFHVGIFLAGLLTVAQFSFWGNYLPTVYPLHLRGTGEGFAANIGGRMLGTSFAWVTSEIAGRVHFGSDPVNMAYTAAGVALFVYLVGSIACFFLPEPKGELTE